MFLPRLPQTNSLQHTQTNILAVSTSSPNKETKKKKKKTTKTKVLAVTKKKKKKKLYLGNMATCHGREEAVQRT